MSKNDKRLTANQRDILLDLIAADHTNSFIDNYSQQNWDISLTKQNIHYHRNRWRDKIEEKKKKLMEDIPIIDRAYRQKMRFMLIQDLLQQDRLWVEQESKGGKKRLIGHHLAIDRILNSAAQDQGDSTGDDSIVIQFKTLLQLKGDAAMHFLKTGKMPTPEMIAKGKEENGKMKALKEG